jgi:hypothetical protein
VDSIGKHVSPLNGYCRFSNETTVSLESIVIINSPPEAIRCSIKLYNMSLKPYNVR